MQNFTKPFLLPMFGLLVAGICDNSFALGAPVTVRTTKDFRELIVKGERPEIAACMVAALNYVRKSPKFESMRWNDEDSDAAIMRETEKDGHLLRSVHFNAQLRLRENSFFSDAWRSSEVVCEQHDEASPEVHLSVSAP